MQILIVDKEVLFEVLQRIEKNDKRLPKCKIVAYDSTVWVAVDNSTGQCWTEDFDTQAEATEWLMPA